MKYALQTSLLPNFQLRSVIGITKRKTECKREILVSDIPAAANN